MDNKTMHVVDVVSGASYKAGGSVAATAGAANWFGLTQSEWTIVIGMGGLIVGILGVIVNGFIKYAEHRDKKLHRAAQLRLSLSMTRKNQK